MREPRCEFSAGFRDDIPDEGVPERGAAREAWRGQISFHIRIVSASLHHAPAEMVNIQSARLPLLAFYTASLSPEQYGGCAPLSKRTVLQRKPLLGNFNRSFQYLR